MKSYYTGRDARSRMGRGSDCAPIPWVGECGNQQSEDYPEGPKDYIRVMKKLDTLNYVYGRSRYMEEGGGLERRVGISKQYAALREQFELLKTELSKLISDRDYLLNTVKPDLEAQYYLRIGKHQYRLFLIRNEVLRMRRKVELIQACVNRGEDPDLKRIERDLDEVLQKWREEVLELSRKIKQAEFQEKLPRLSFETVSYTHLDVYKRQVSTCQLFKRCNIG